MSGSEVGGLSNCVCIIVCALSGTMVYAHLQQIYASLQISEAPLHMGSIKPAMVNSNTRQGLYPVGPG